MSVKKKNKKKNTKINKKMNNDKVSGNKIYEKNLQALRKYYPKIVDKLQNTVVTNYKIYLTGEDSTPNIYINATDSYYYNPKSPLQDAIDQVKELKLRNTKIALFLGLGLGYEFFYFAEYMAEDQDTRYIFVVERDLEIFKLAMKHIDLTLMINHPQLKLIVGAEENELFLEYKGYFSKANRSSLYIKATKPIYHLSALKLSKDYYIDAIRKFKEVALYDLGSSGNSPEDSIIGVKNMLENIDEILNNPGINNLYGKFQNKPAVIVSTGPSLNKNKHLLKGLEDKAVIICPDASLKVLLDMGVKPHLVTSLERVPEVVNLLDGFEAEEVKDVYFAGCPVVVNECYKVYPGPRVIVYRAFDHFRWIDIDRGILNIKPSSGNMAFKIADALGCDPVVLIGQDLAYSRDGKTHASGTHYGENQDSVSKLNKIEVMGNDGKLIDTNYLWDLFLKSYEIDVEQYKGLCINSTEGGAYIKGTQVMPFKDAIDKYINNSFNPLEVIKKNLEQFKPNEKEREKLEGIIEKTMLDMEDIVCLCEKGIELHKKYEEELLTYIKEYSKADEEVKNRIEFIKKDMLKPKEEVYKNRENFQLFFMHIIQPYYINFETNMNGIADAYEDRVIAMADILFKHIDLYNTVGEIAKICLELLKKAKNDIFVEKKVN